ncbi:hypothetical protein NIES4074_11040 [Cylindrospermum sp. NIES-4074]|nr:hypothetical protein NIES4074_11040 [Cylindrospermum sp. NIES-4074]
MPENLEKHFLEAARKLKQKKRTRLLRKIGAILLLVVIVSGFAYLLHQGVPILKMGNLSISATTLVLSIIGLIFIVSLVIFSIKNKVSINRYQSSVFSLESLRIGRFKRIKTKYLLGYILLLILLIYQTNPSLFTHPINRFVTHVVYNPRPPVLNSPWPWKNRAMIHPIVANMPSNIETSIESVAKYIAQQESDPYLRIKAIHDYVVSRVTYDLDVLKTGIRPSQKAQTVFSTHKGVCEGYANLFMALGRAMGADVVYIRGKIRRDFAPLDLIPKVFRLLKSNYDWTNHAWNAVKILDNWQLVDTTWDDNDSSALNSPYSADYLIVPPQVMSISHFPEQLDWQLLHHREDYNTFEKKPILTPQFFIDELRLISPTEYKTNVQKVAAIKIASHQNYQNKISAVFTKAQKADSLVGDLLEGDQDTQPKQQDRTQCQSQSNAGGETQISCHFPEPGDYEVSIGYLEKEILLGKLKFHAL